MARKINRLKTKRIENAKPDNPYGSKPTVLPDGNNLHLQISRGKNGDVNKSWLFKYQFGHCRHELGLGSFPGIGLAAARELARHFKTEIAKGIDPIIARQEAKRTALAAKAEKTKAITFKQTAEMYLDVHADRWKNPKHRAQWRSTLETYAFPIIGDLSVRDIDESHLLKVLQPHWKRVPETASRLRARIENVLGYAIASRFRSGDNPARWRGHLKTLLGGAPKEVEHHPALPFLEAPAFLAELRERDSTSARALELLILTAARTNEVLGARWSEIDLKHKVWTIPPGRMKTNIEHRVPLCDRAIEILRARPHRGTHVFTGTSGHPLSNMALLELLRGMRLGLTVHGFRSTFRDWAAERTNHPNYVAEKALAHAIPDKVEKAYRRGELFTKRANMMKQWASFLAKPAKAADVADIGEERAKRGSGKAAR